ncbi:hypothetical protein [Nonlabens dokdonensis]|nr:hypothetical protein [Nonlabens dokdonensis]
MTKLVGAGELCFNNVACYGVSTLMGLVNPVAGILAGGACLFAGCDGEDDGSTTWYSW